MRDMLKEGISMVKVDVAIMAVVVRAGSTRSTTTDDCMSIFLLQLIIKEYRCVYFHFYYLLQPLLR